LLADAEVMPEYLTTVDVSGDLAAWARRWLDDPKQRAEASARLAAVRDRVAAPGASDRAAEHILAALDARPQAPSHGPHARRGEAADRPAPV
jgi:lipid-A-disaccharide synthase